MATARASRTPNPNAMKFTLDVALPAEIDVRAGDDSDDPFVSAVLGLEGVEAVFGVNDFVTVTRAADADWDPIVCGVEDAVCEHLADTGGTAGEDRVTAAQKLLREAASTPQPTPVEIRSDPS